MSIWRFIRRSLWFYRRQHLGVAAGAALGAMVLVGALGIGDSVQHTLYQSAHKRLGRVTQVIFSEDRLVQSTLAERLNQHHAITTAAVLQLPGIAIAGGGERRVGNVQISGITDSFFKLAPVPQTLPAPASEQAYLNRELAAQLGVGVGDELLIRLRRPHALPVDAPLSPTAEFTTAARVTITRILTSDEFGEFSMQNDQRSPLNCFVSLPWLNAVCELDDRATLMLTGTDQERAPSQAEISQALQAVWQLADAQLEVAPTKSQQLELRTDRVFLGASVTAAANRLFPQNQSMLTYFVNSLRTESTLTPYSFITGVDIPQTQGLGDRELIISQWLADDLKVQAGAHLDCEYFVPTAGDRLSRKTIRFTVRQVIPQAEWPGDSSWMPAFPGLADSENCRDWDPGIPIDLTLIRDHDERYWQEYGGTPKALLSLAAARALWANRFGDTSAIRISDDTKIADIREQLEQSLSPLELGIRVVDVAESAQRAADQAVDLGQIFIGLSFFLICAALLLTALLFRFSIEQRSNETGLLLATGLSYGWIRRALMIENSCSTVIGSLLGGVAGILYCRIVVHFLNTIWSGAVASATIQPAVRGASIAIGVAVIAGVCFTAMLITLRHQIGQTIRQLQQDPGGQLPGGGSHRKGILLLGVSLVIAAAALIPILDAQRGQDAAAAFFGIGALFLAGALILCYGLLTFIGNRPGNCRPGVLRLALRNCARRPLRSTASAAILACGTFLVVAVSANRHPPDANPEQRQAGTGGFALYVETALPLKKDLNASDVRDELLLNDPLLQPLNFLPIRVRAGDDASCLNLNRAQSPRLLGVPASALRERGAFRFTATMDTLAADDGWDLLHHEFDDGAVPGIADYTVIVWGLGKQPGDTLHYVDENGRALKVRLVAGIGNSIFQGSILIAEHHFVQRYPSVGGYRLFLVDGPHSELDQRATAIRNALADFGVHCTPTSERLANFSQVETTYLTVFLALGGLGLALGTLGLGILVLRNALEREGELAVLQAIGLSRTQIFQQLTMEHMFLVCAGLDIGLVAGLAAVLPVLLTAGRRVPVQGLVVFTIAILLVGTLAVVIANGFVLRRNFQESLREL